MSRRHPDPCLFVLDTNVLVHDPAALFRFQEHDLFLPLVVLEELDAGKKGLSEVARNIRQVSRFLDGLIGDASKAEIDAGLPLQSPLAAELPEGAASGRLYFQTRQPVRSLPEALSANPADHQILATSLALAAERPDRRVVLVSKDINLRIKAAVLGIPAEDYASDQVLDDATLLYSGLSRLDPQLWERHARKLEGKGEAGRTRYRISGPEVMGWYPNQCLYLEGEPGLDLILRGKPTPDSALLERVTDFTIAGRGVWGIQARNREQNFALNLLMDPELDFVSLVGPAGTGKTLLTLAAGLAQVLDHNRYREIVMTRVTVPVGEDIGFLPGTEEEKMTPWMGALMDNLEVLAQPEGGGWGRAATNDLLRSRIRIHSLNFMRGRTFLNKLIILDEAQNLTPKQMKTLITRAGPGTKLVCLGNIAQIDTPYLTETSSGLTYVVDRFKSWGHSGHITLVRGERSRLADFASAEL